MSSAEIALAYRAPKLFFATKKAMVDLYYDHGIMMQLQVHDELDGSIEMHQVETIAEVMEHAVELLVPTKVDVSIGPDWGHTEKGE